MLDFSKTYPLTSEHHTKLLAESLAKIVTKGDIFLLEGDLGSGKTTFARFFIRFFLQGEEVPSPTFTIVQTYPTENFTIWHFDLYRLKDSKELEEIGVEEAFYCGVSLVEWPEKLNHYKLKECLSLFFEGEEDQKKVTISGTEKWEKRLNELGKI